MNYFFNITEDDDGFTVIFPDIPEAITCGETKEEAIRNAQDCLEVALEFYIESGKPIPELKTITENYVWTMGNEYRLWNKKNSNRMLRADELLGWLDEVLPDYYHEFSDSRDVRDFYRAVIEKINELTKGDIDENNK